MKLTWTPERRDYHSAWYEMRWWMLFLWAFILAFGAFMVWRVEPILRFVVILVMLSGVAALLWERQRYGALADFPAKMGVQQVTVEIDDEVIRDLSIPEAGAIPWTWIKSHQEGRKVHILRVHNGSLIVIPKRAMDEAQDTALMGFIAAHVQK